MFTSSKYGRDIGGKTLHWNIKKSSCLLSDNAIGNLDLTRILDQFVTFLLQLHTVKIWIWNSLERKYNKENIRTRRWFTVRVWSDYSKRSGSPGIERLTVGWLDVFVSTSWLTNSFLCPYTGIFGSVLPTDPSYHLIYLPTKFGNTKFHRVTRRFWSRVRELVLRLM